MDLEDVLDRPSEHPEETLQPAADDDVLGLDKQIKLTKRAKIAKIDNQRMFNNHTGVNHITKNYPSMIRTIKKHDKAFEKNSGKVTKAQKYEHEYDNLTTVLQFYQLWCHGLFPKARFKDCIHLIRNLGARSPQLKVYRRQLIEMELSKLRVEKGIVDEAEPETNEALDVRVDEGIQQPETNDPVESQVPQEEDEDSIHRPRPARSNGLFVGDDDEDDLYSTPSVPVVPVIPAVPSQPSQATQQAQYSDSQPSQALSEPPQASDNFSDDPFSDDEFPVESNQAHGAPPGTKHVEDSVLEPDDFDNHPEYDEELELMREFD